MPQEASPPTTTENSQTTVMTPFTMAATMKKIRRFSTSRGRTGIVAGGIGGGGGTVSDIRDGYILSAKSLTTGRRKR